MTSPCASVSPSGTLGYNSPYLREIRTQWVNDCNVLPLVAAHGVGSLYQNALTAPPHNIQLALKELAHQTP